MKIFAAIQYTAVAAARLVMGGIIGRLVLTLLAVVPAAPDAPEIPEAPKEDWLGMVAGGEDEVTLAAEDVDR
jgi:hypothetical protein